MIVGTIEPTLEFRYSTKKLLMFTSAGFFYGACSILFLLDLIIRPMPKERNIIAAVATIYCAIVAVAAMRILWQRLGGKIEIRDGKLRALRRNGTVRAEGYLADITELNWLTSWTNELSTELVVEFSDDQVLRFETQVENCLELLRALEHQTGKSFAYVSRKG